jgi:DNA-directed RNA polymerase specialized sigma24 family protein
MEDQETESLDTPSMESYKDSLVNELINDALNSLPEIYRQVVTLHYLGGMKDSEIAEFRPILWRTLLQR